MTLHRPTARDALIAAAFDVFSKDPSASLAQIADRAGVGRATLHRQFASREALFRELALIAIKEIDEAVTVATADAKTATDALRRTVFAVIPLGGRQGFLAGETGIDDPNVLAEYQRQSDELYALIDASKAEGGFDRTIPTDWIAQAFEGLVYAAWEAVRLDQLTQKQAGDLAWRTLLSGLQDASQ